MADAITPDACLTRIAAGDVASVYFVHGPDTEQKGRVVAALVDTVEEDLRAFNVDRLYAAEAKPDLRRQLWAVLDLARTVPMLAARRIVVLQGAERVLQALRDEDGKSDEIDALEAYLKQPDPGAALVFVAEGAPDRRLKVVSTVEKHATVVSCDPLGEKGDGPAAWLKAAAAREGVRIQPEAVRFLAALAGNDIDRLRAEFDRALLFAAGDGIMTEAAVREVVGARTSQDTWALNNALRAGDTRRALVELRLKLEAGEPPYLILGQIASFVRKDLRADQIKPALEALLTTDLNMKTSRGDGGIALERLVVKLCR